MKPGGSAIHFTKSISEALRLPRTAELIMENLARARRYLSVKELVKRVKMSERSVRKHLIVLIRRGFLRRRAVHGASRRIAYEYSLCTVEEMLGATRRDFTRTLRSLEGFVRRVGGAGRKKASPRSASYGRN